MAYSGVYFN